MGGKKRETIFPEKHEYCQLEMLGKISYQKSAKTLFLYSHENRDQKMGEKNARNNFSRNTRIVRAKNVGKKIVSKKCENTFFYIHTNIVTKK